MKKTSLLSQLAMAGIAAGLVSTAYSADAYNAVPADSSQKAAAMATKDSAKTAAPAKKKKKAAKKDSTAVADSAKTGMAPAAHDSTMSKHMAADTAKAMGKATAGKHGCKGMNSCKGQGGCKMGQADLDAASKKLGVPADKAGKAHGCKGMNECKGLGGCKAS